MLSSAFWSEMLFCQHWLLSKWQFCNRQQLPESTTLSNNWSTAVWLKLPCSAMLVLLIWSMPSTFQHHLTGTWKWEPWGNSDNLRWHQESFVKSFHCGCFVFNCIVFNLICKSKKKKKNQNQKRNLWQMQQFYLSMGLLQCFSSRFGVSSRVKFIS